MNEVTKKPKFSFERGLKFMNEITPMSRVKIYRTYLNHLDDNQVLGAVLMKSVNRCSSLGLITEELYWEFREAFDYFKKENMVKSLRGVDYNKVLDSEVMWPKLKNFVNLLGIQSSNCQVTFNHRYILNELEVGVVAEIAIAAISHSAERYIILNDLAEELIRSIFEYMEDGERVEEDPDYNRFNMPDIHNRHDFVTEDQGNNHY